MSPSETFSSPAFWRLPSGIIVLPGHANEHETHAASVRVGVAQDVRTLQAVRQHERLVG